MNNILSITSENVKAYAGSSANFNRGKKMIENIYDYEVEQGIGSDITIKSETLSSDGFNSYYQTIQIDNGSIRGNCTCPVGHRCKHIVAVLLNFIDDYGEESVEPLLDPFSKRDSKSPMDIERERQKSMAKSNLRFWSNNFSYEYEELTRKSSVNYRISYVLDSNGLGKVSLSIEKIRIKKNGSLGATSSVSINQKKSPVFIESEDLHIYELCRLSQSTNSKRGYYGSDSQNSVELSGVSGDMILHKTLQSGMLRYGKSDKYLQWSDIKVRGSLLWIEDDSYIPDMESRKVILTISTGNPNIKAVLGLQRNYYIDIEKATIGLLQNLPESKVLKLLMDTAPAVDKTLLKEEWRELKQKVPILPPIERDEVVREQPTAELIVDRSGVELHFNYGDETLPYDRDSETFVERNGVTVERFRDFEESAVEELRREGLNLKEGNRFQMGVGDETPNGVELWREFYENGAEKLKENGWSVDIDENSKLQFNSVSESDFDFEVSGTDGGEWFKMDFFIDIEGNQIKLAPLVDHYLSTGGDDSSSQMVNIPIANRQYIRVERSSVQPIINTVLKLYNRETGQIEVDGFEAHELQLPNELQRELEQRHSSISDLQKRLKEFRQIDRVEPPEGLNAELREYQRDGLNWLNFLREYGFSGILADDMGLGKTIQTLAFLLREKQQGRLTNPVLITVPTSLLGNWRRESERFTPDLSVAIMHNSGRKKLYRNIKEGEISFDILITTYGLILRDMKELSELHFNHIILDEAQKIKNPKAKVTQNLKSLKSNYRLCLTGTPMENHLGELWSLFSFLMPNFLLTEDSFNRFFRNPIEKDGDEDAQQRLRDRIKPFILRRNKSEVATELPPKTEILQRVTFDSKQTKLYESIRVTMEKRVRETITNNGLAKSQIAILDALLKLRQVCCDPRLLKMDEAKNFKESAKLDALFDLLEELLQENRKVLLFSQFTSMLEIIEDRLGDNGISYSKLTGATRDRDGAIQSFKNGDTDLFLISLKAGGVGLNLTEADTVIIYDPWWNPAVENQAIDRAYRIGQNRSVFVYRFIVEGSVEEKIIELQKKKQNLSDSVLQESGDSYSITEDDIKDLFAPIK
jgi:superfamily II DNA or RNA helicase